MHGAPLATVRKWQGCGIWVLKTSRLLEDVTSVWRMEGKASEVSDISGSPGSMETHHYVRRQALPCREPEEAFGFSELCSQAYRGLGKD